VVSQNVRPDVGLGAPLHVGMAKLEDDFR